MTSPALFLFFSLFLPLSNHPSIPPSLFFFIYHSSFFASSIPFFCLFSSIYLHPSIFYLFPSICSSSIHQSICHLIHLSSYPSIYPSISYQTIHPFIHPSISLWFHHSFTHPSLSFHPTIYLFLSNHPSLLASIHPSLFPSLLPSLSLCYSRSLSLSLSLSFRFPSASF